MCELGVMNDNQARLTNVWVESNKAYDGIVFITGQCGDNIPYTYDDDDVVDVVLSNCTMKGNIDRSYGGALYNNLPNVRVYNSVFESNVISGDNPYVALSCRRHGDR